MEDITGNSFIENPFAPNEDPATVVKYFTRSQEQDRKLGIYEEEATVQDEKDSKENEKEVKEEGSLVFKYKIWIFCAFLSSLFLKSE